MDFYNMLERERLESKKISKTNAVTSIMDHELPAERRLHRPVGLRAVADRPQVGAHPRRGPGVRRRAAERRAEARGVGLAELRRHRDRRRALLQARAQPRRRRPARRALLLPDEVAAQPAPRRPGARRTPRSSSPSYAGRPGARASGRARAGARAKARERRPRSPPRRRAANGRPGRSGEVARARRLAGAIIVEAMSASFSIAHVTPYPWEAENEVNAHVRARRRASSRGAGTACWCSRRRARRSGCAPRAGRCARRAADRQSLLEGTDGGSPARDRRRRGARRRRAAPGGDRRRSRSTSRARSRNCSARSSSTSCTCTSRSRRAPPTPRCATRARSTSARSTPPAERLLSTLVARRFVESFFGRLDARTASPPATAELMARHFPGDYRLVPDDEAARRTSSSGSTRELAARRHSREGDARAAPRGSRRGR